MPRKADTPAEKEERISEMLLRQSAAAVNDLPIIEQRARDWVADAQENLRVAQANLDYVLNVEIPATKGNAGKAG